jgi:hypothetical protein
MAFIVSIVRYKLQLQYRIFDSLVFLSRHLIIFISILNYLCLHYHLLGQYSVWLQTGRPGNRGSNPG